MDGTAMSTMNARIEHYDVVVVGSGFGGSVAALRLTEKGYRVAVLEAGRRFADEDFAKTSWRARDYLWAPKLGLKGIQRIHVLPDVVVLAGAGVGGGSLVYANTLYVPPKPFFEDPQWAGIADWESELAPYYDQAQRMLGVVENPTMTPADDAMYAVAKAMGVEDTFKLTPVGVHFGAGAGVESPDPYFGGAGPARHGCTECGECMTGCRHNAKNTLPKNYLGLAEAGGARVVPEATVTRIGPRSAGGYAVAYERTGAWAARDPRVLTADHVIVAAGTYGTQKLLHRMRGEGWLPGLSARLGHKSRTNSESLLGAVAKRTDPDYSKGVAITSSFFPEPHTHIEPCRYGHGSNAMGLLGTVLTDEEPGVPRLRTWLRAVVRNPREAAATLNVRKWSQRGVIALVMQTVDNSIVVGARRSRLGAWKLTTAQSGEPNPTWIPAGNAAVRHLAEHVDGRPMGNLGEVFNAPMTAHFIGGCVIGDSPETGVVDAYHRAFGHEGLHIMDGSTISANLGVNPSLTITAQAERAVAMWPNKGEPDARPALGEPYRRVEPVAPVRPQVPEHAPGGLRLRPVS